MDIPHEAIEAAATAMSKASPEVFSGEAWRFLAHEAIEAALPALERQIRWHVAAEIRDVIDTDESTGEWEESFERGMIRAAQIAQGTQA